MPVLNVEQVLLKLHRKVCHDMKDLRSTHRNRSAHCVAEAELGFNLNLPASLPQYNGSS